MANITDDYQEIDSRAVPAGIRFDVPRRYQGQTVEYAFGGPASGRGEHGPGDPYLRVTDRSEPPGRRVTFYRRK